ncbi:hypothetical protein [Blastococcus sp. CCUG 61487]|uniref:hypothetical protein n=1 Tax=Blastococcus sp. CCUG 61487 TaxID=1840703 RepID=UPI0010C10EEE|nr:hypothetical protein [Blastococcus sp. CCUG 61487]TKJ25252.1 hypothetical protein A6V29_04320 [Blastococcus sp. CCUG 61487]
MSALLGAADPADVDDELAAVCAAQSDRLPGVDMPFVCTRPPGHTATDREHVASGPYPGVGKIAVAAWVDGGAPRVIDAVTLQRVRQRGRPL